MVSHRAKHKHAQKRRLQLTLLVSSLVFLSSTGIGAVQMLWNGLHPAAPIASSPAAESPQPDLAAQVRGYQLVLEREPDNRTALEGLATAQLELGQASGAIAPLTRLVELYPGQPRYQTWLEQAQQQAGSPVP